MSDVKLLSEATNYAVVHLPERQFPGIVFQGDSLNALISDFNSIAGETDESERVFALNDVIERLEAVRSRYEVVLDREEMPNAIRANKCPLAQLFSPLPIPET